MASSLHWYHFLCLPTCYEVLASQSPFVHTAIPIFVCSFAHSSGFPCILTIALRCTLLQLSLHPYQYPLPRHIRIHVVRRAVSAIGTFGGLLPSPVRYPQCSRRYGGLPPNFVHHKSSPHLDPSFHPSFPFALLCPILNLTHSFIYVNSAKLTRGFYLCFSRALFTDKTSTYIKTIQRHIHIGPKKF